MRLRFTPRSVLAAIFALLFLGAVGTQVSGALTTAGDTPTPTAAQADSAFRMLSSSLDTGTPSRVPTIQPDAKVVQRGTVGRSATLALTDSHELCLNVDGTQTCQPQAAAIASGVFVAAMDCNANPVQATIYGVVPSGVSDVTATRKGNAVGHAVADANGYVKLKVSGDLTDAIQAGAASSPLQLRCPSPDAPVETATTNSPG